LLGFRRLLLLLALSMYSPLLLQHLGALGLHVIKCWGEYFMSTVETAMVGLQVAILVVSQELSAHEVTAATE
jgi:hypothetical protein